MTITTLHYQITEMKLISRILPRVSAIATAGLLALAATGAQAQLLNGDFSSNGGQGQLTVNTTLASWTAGGKEGTFGGQTTAPVFVFASSNAGGTVTGSGYMGNIGFYSLAAPPSGSFFIAADGDSGYAGSISQIVNGLTAGNEYKLKFDWAGAQQTGYSGATTERWQVSFGGSTDTTPTVNVPSQSSSTWQTTTLTFTADSASQLLSFLAIGTPNGQPPWLVLSGVSLTDATTPPVPEPGTLAMLAVGMAGLVLVRRRSQRSAD